jgi:predicted secreted hydrolase
MLTGSQPDKLSGSNITFLEDQSGIEENNYMKAIDRTDFDFPDDHGAHPEYLTEWWYYTGNLFTDDDRHFGYQLTFFRRAISDQLVDSNASNWASNQIYLAHFAVTDTASNQHYVFDQISRGSAGLAGTSVDPLFSIWLKDWEIVQLSENVFQMNAGFEDVEINLLLTNIKGIIFHGDDGLSQKGSEIGNASYYFSQTRMETVGTIRISDEEFDVNGFSWMDHEFGTSTLGSDQIGWDWFSIQLDNQTEIMLFQIRQEDGSVSEFSSGTIINREGITENLQVNDFKIEVLDTWQTNDQVTYPNKWEIDIEQINLKMEITPVMNDQEMNLFFRYWEGAVRLNGTLNGEEITGYGYVELTGYAQSMQGVF